MDALMFSPWSLLLSFSLVVIAMVISCSRSRLNARYILGHF